jgi:hypothetical protein
MDTRKFGNEISETKNNEKKYVARKRYHLNNLQGFMRTGIEIERLFLSAM